MSLSADFRVTLDDVQVRRLITAGYLAPDPGCPGELRDALAALIAALPMPKPATPNHEQRA